MTELFELIKGNGDVVFHGKYRLYKYHKESGLFLIAFDAGAVRQIVLEMPSFSQDTTVSVFFEDGQISRWKTKWISSYIYQFGVAASFDGEYIFIQTWENGLLCVDVYTGEIVWRTDRKSVV